MQALFLAIFAAGAVILDQIIKYLTVTNIAIDPQCIRHFVDQYGYEVTMAKIDKLHNAFGLTEEQLATMPLEKPGLGNVFHCSHVLNDGAAWSSFSGMQWLFILIFALFTVAIIWEYRKQSMKFTRFEWWCIAAIYGGGLGNIIDRVRFGFVIDMIDLDFSPLRSFPVFNVADCFITCGCIALMVHLVFFNKQFWKGEKKK